MDAGCQATLLVFIALLLCVPSASANRHRRPGWRNLRQAAERLECNREFHDQQSKWLQSPLVVSAHWLAGDEQRSRERTHRFNITVTVQSVLKETTSSGRIRLRSGSRITIGEFSGALARHRDGFQKQLCTPGRLGEGRRGYVFFLTPTGDPNYFRHSFLPVKLNPGNLRKFNAVRCSQPSNCPRAPRLVKAVPKGVKTNDRTREISMRFVCRAHGRPLPVVRWLKDGVELSYSQRVKAQFRRRAHSIVSRLIVKPVELTDAGNYTCHFSNLNGSVNASFEIAAATVLNSKRSPTMKAPAYMCEAADLTRCMNGGTCVISRWSDPPRCICPKGHSGKNCEKTDIVEVFVA